jgi:hypothetical protein
MIRRELPRLVETFAALIPPSAGASRSSRFALRAERPYVS